MPTRRDPAVLVDEARAGDRGALARLLSLVERGGEPAREVERRTFALGGTAYTVGITGAPGAGKSTLTSALVDQVRAGGDEVAVLAIDPSSPYSGGAILGDRVRMQDHELDPGVFVRSMATRGHLGGLALAARQAVRVLDAVGRPWVLVETVGVGQVEVEVAGAADTTVVVVNPGWGDAVQAAKAGLIEIADVFVINKADRPGAGDTRRDLLQVLDLSPSAGWRPPVIDAVAVEGRGADEVWAAVVDHRRHLEATGELPTRRAARLEEELELVITARLRERARDLCATAGGERLRAAVAGRRVDPYAAADELLGPLA
jgi:LAO/AO transport system kinase